MHILNENIILANVFVKYDKTYDKALEIKGLRGSHFRHLIKAEKFSAHAPNTGRNNGQI